MQPHYLNRFVRVFTLILYLAIPVKGEHIGGPLVIFLLFGFFDSSLLLATETILILQTLIILLLTIFLPRVRRNRVIVPCGLIILFIPLIQHWLYLAEYSQWVNERAFIIGSMAFAALSLLWMVNTFRGKYAAQVNSLIHSGEQE